MGFEPPRPLYTPVGVLIVNKSVDTISDVEISKQVTKAVPNYTTDNFPLSFITGQCFLQLFHVRQGLKK